MTPELVLDRLQVAVAVALTMLGVIGVWVSTNGAKRLGAVLLALMGATIALAALGMPGPMLTAGAAAALAVLIVGAGLLVRMQESYGSTESGDLDAVDAQSETEPRA